MSTLRMLPLCAMTALCTAFWLTPHIATAEETAAEIVEVSGGVDAPPPPEEKRKVTRIEMAPGVRAQLFLPITPNEWPITKLPEVPSETVILPSFPQVEASAEFGGGSGPTTAQGNLLVKSSVGLLDDASSYVVVFNGFIYAREDGVFAITVRSDDPVKVEVEGSQIINSTFSTAWPRNSAASPLTATNVGHFRAAKGRYYNLVITAQQRRRLHGNETILSAAKENIHGAQLNVWLTQPEGQPEPIRTFIKREVVVEE